MVLADLFLGLASVGAWAADPYSQVAADWQKAQLKYYEYLKTQGATASKEDRLDARDRIFKEVMEKRARVGQESFKAGIQDGLKTRKGSLGSVPRMQSDVPKGEVGDQGSPSSQTRSGEPSIDSDQKSGWVLDSKDIPKELEFPGAKKVKKE